MRNRLKTTDSSFCKQFDKMEKKKIICIFLKIMTIEQDLSMSYMIILQKNVKTLNLLLTD